MITNISISITTLGEDDIEMSLDEVIRRIKDGFTSGHDKSEVASYSFDVLTQDPPPKLNGKSVNELLEETLAKYRSGPSCLTGMPKNLHEMTCLSQKTITPTPLGMFWKIWTPSAEYLIENSGMLTIDETESYLSYEFHRVVATENLPVHGVKDWVALERILGWLYDESTVHNYTVVHPLTDTLGNLNHLSRITPLGCIDGQSFKDFCLMTDEYPSGATFGEFRKGWYYWMFCENLDPNHSIGHWHEHIGDE